MKKNELETKIIDGIKAIRSNHDSKDAETRADLNKFESNGIKVDWNHHFFFNGYIYESELFDVICEAMFGHSSQKYVSVNIKGGSWVGGTNYKSNISSEEFEIVKKVVNGMEKANLIKASKSRAMFKVLV